MERSAKEILNELKKYEPYTTLSIGKIAKQLGYDNHRFETELDRLETNEAEIEILTNELKKYKFYKNITTNKVRENFDHYTNILEQLQKEFLYFDQLPDELQAKIFSEEPRLIRKSIILNKSARQSPHISSAYYNHYCDFPITVEEVSKYIDSYHGNIDIVFFTKNGKFIYYHRIYGGKVDRYIVNTMKVSLNSVDEDINLSNDIRNYHYDNYMDVYNTYQIYKSRTCESIKPGYAKIKVKEFVINIMDTALTKVILKI